MGNVKLLDCTLRDGSYIVNGNFGEATLKAVIHNLTEARTDIVEVGWLKDAEYKLGTAFYHVPSDAAYVIGQKNEDVTYVAMIDYNRYDDSVLPECDGQTIDAIRVVFPYKHHEEGLAIASRIKEKGYKIYLQAANTLIYTEEDLITLAKATNEVMPKGLSIVDTFGAMGFEDIEHISGILHRELDPSIALGFHSHNNQQLSYALSIRFAEIVSKTQRDAIVDASLCGMGRGAGNTPTELMASYLNDKFNGNYDMNEIMDTIDTYMAYFLENYKWGYSTPYMIAGKYCCHVNNIAYLLENHRTKAKDIRNIIGSLTPEQRLAYDYDVLEEKYIDNQSRKVEDEESIQYFKDKMSGRKVLLVAPGKSSMKEQNRILEFIEKENPVVVGVNAIIEGYRYDDLFLVNSARYDYAKGSHSEAFYNTERIILSNIKTKPEEGEYIISFDKVIKRGYPHFDNSVITCLRFLNLIHCKDVAIVGFDGFKNAYNDSYADEQLPTLNPEGKWVELNEEIKQMTREFIDSTKDRMRIEFITESIFNED